MSPRDVDGHGRVDDPDAPGSDINLPDETETGPDAAALDDVFARWRADVTRPVRVDPALAAMLRDGLTAPSPVALPPASVQVGEEHLPPAVELAPVISIDDAPSRRGRARRIAVRAAVIGAASVTVSGGLAAAGVLPTPVQRVVSHAADAVGIQITEPARPRLAPKPTSSLAAAREVEVPSTVEHRAETSTATSKPATSKTAPSKTATGETGPANEATTAGTDPTSSPTTHAKPPKGGGGAATDGDDAATPTKPDKSHGQGNARPCRARRGNHGSDERAGSGSRSGSDSEARDGRRTRRCRPCRANAHNEPRPNSCRRPRGEHAERPPRDGRPGRNNRSVPEDGRAEKRDRKRIDDR